MASFSTSPANYTNSSDANFRTWGSYLSGRKAAVGLVQTADTGQVNWTTATAPIIANSYLNYEIWRFADSLQATAPVFIKVEYGSNTSTNNPGVRVQFGSGSNGAGTLTGAVSAQYLAAVTATTTAVEVKGSGGTARFCVAAAFTTSGTYCMQYGFERSKDASGNDTAEAVLGFFNNSPSGNSTSARYVPVWSTTLGDIGSTSTMAVPALFPPGATATSGSQIVVSPILHSKGIFMNPGMNFLGYYSESIASNGTPSIYMYGATRTYYTLPQNAGVAGSGWQGPGAGTECLAIRYD